MKNFFDDKNYNKRILESENFIVIPSLGSLVPGWLLIIPKRFYINLSKLPLSAFNELQDIIEQLKYRALPKFGDKYVLFEHGPNSQNSDAGCGVDYAHLHFVPCDFDLREGIKSFLKLEYDWKSLNNINEIIKSNNVINDYLYLRDQTGKHFITFQNTIPSQTFRKVIANYLQIPQYFDWKTNYSSENIDLTIDKLLLEHV